MAQRKSSGIVELIKTFFYAALIAIVIRTLLFEPFSIPSGSMIPTLLVGDYLFVSKYSYGYSRHSFPFSLAPFEGRIFGSPPERGDVVVFKLPSDGTTDYIKRVVGLPGDRVQMREGVLYINDEPVPRTAVGPYTYADEFGRVRRFTEYEEDLPDGRKHAIIKEDETPNGWGMPNNTKEYVVPEDHFFAMGDNRDRSKDSRYADVGMVPFENIVGRAEIIFFSIDGSFFEFWDWPDTIRGSRLFKHIQ